MLSHKTLKHFSYIVTQTLKLQKINSCCGFNRKIFTASIANSSKPFNRNLYEEDDCNKNNKDPPELGKIVAIENLEDLGEYCKENTSTRRKKKEKNTFLEDREDGNSEENVTEESEIKNIESESKETRINFSSIRDKPQLLTSVMINLKSRRRREKQQAILLEGKRLIHDALSAGLELQQLFFSRLSDIESFNLSDKVRVYKTSYKNLKMWSDVVTSQGVIAVFKMPDVLVPKESADNIPLTVICDNVREPGNLGSILRVVAGVGCKKLILTKGCVDLWDPKVLRSAAGAHFRLAINTNLTWTDIETQVEGDSQIVLADCTLPEKDSTSSGGPGKSLLYKSGCDAAMDLPLTTYYNQEYCNKEVVIVVGGETHGLSVEAYDFAKKRQGTRVYIPMSNNIESLNTGVALGILSYEIRRQWENMKILNSRNELSNLVTESGSQAENLGTNTTAPSADAKVENI